MSMMTAETAALRRTIDEHRQELVEVLHQYGASNPRLFGSVARGDATENSDIDVIVDLNAGGGSVLLRLGGITEGFRQALNHPVDVVSSEILRDSVHPTAMTDAVAL